MNKQEQLAEQILKKHWDEVYNTPGQDYYIGAHSQLGKTYKLFIAAIVEAMGVPTTEADDVGDRPEINWWGGVSEKDMHQYYKDLAAWEVKRSQLTTAPAKAVEAMPDSKVLKLMKDIPSQPLPVRWVQDEDMNQNYMAGFFTAFRYREAMDSLPAQTNKRDYLKYLGYVASSNNSSSDIGDAPFESSNSIEQEVPLKLHIEYFPLLNKVLNDERIATNDKTNLENI